MYFGQVDYDAMNVSTGRRRPGFSRLAQATSSRAKGKKSRVDVSDEALMLARKVGARGGGGDSIFLRQSSHASESCLDSIRTQHLARRRDAV